MSRRPRLAAGTALLLIAAVSGCGTTTTPASDGSDFPKKGSTIEWVVPSAAGAGNDILARIMAPAMQEDLGANVKVVNREGGNQVIGLNQVAAAKPDGQTIGYTNIPSILGRYLDPSKKAGFDRGSFTPVGSFASNDVIIAVNKDSSYQSIEDLVDGVKKDHGKVTAATDSRAGDDHVNLRILEKQLELDMNIVHYNSGADKVAALVSGEVDVALGGVSSFYGPYKSGDLKILAVVDDDGSSFLPDVPTMKSAGYEVDSMTNNFAVSVPKGTPQPIVDRLEASLKKTSEDPDVRAKLKDAATEPTWESADDVATLWEQREKETKPIIDELLAEQE